MRSIHFGRPILRMMMRRIVSRKNLGGNFGDDRIRTLSALKDNELNRSGQEQGSISN